MQSPFCQMDKYAVSRRNAYSQSKLSMPSSPSNLNVCACVYIERPTSPFVIVGYKLFRPPRKSRELPSEVNVFCFLSVPTLALGKLVCKQRHASNISRYFKVEKWSALLIVSHATAWEPGRARYTTGCK